MKGATLKTGVSLTRTVPVEAMAEEVDTTIGIEDPTGVMAVEDISHQEEGAETVVATKKIEEVAEDTTRDRPEKEAGENRAATIMVEEEITNRMKAAGMDPKAMVETKESRRALVGVEAQLWELVIQEEVDMAAKISDLEQPKVLLAMHHLWGIGIRPKGVARALMSTLAT